MSEFPDYEEGLLARYRVKPWAERWWKPWDSVGKHWVPYTKIGDIFYAANYPEGDEDE